MTFTLPRGPWPRVFIIFQVFLLSVTHGSNFQRGIFREMSSLSDYIVMDWALWVRENVFDELLCTKLCFEDMSCKSFFYSSVNGSCFGHSNVFSSTATATAASGAVYYKRIGNAEEAGPVEYTYHHKQKAWSDARSTCKGNGGDLASLDTLARVQNAATYFQVHKQTHNIRNAVWVGMKRNSSNNVLYWNNGNIVGSATTWARDYPLSDKDCGYTSTFSHLVMKNFDCYLKMAFLCETPEQ